VAENDVPDGVPIGRALLIASGYVYEELRHMVAVVSRIHGDGELPTIPVLLTASLEERGRFVQRSGQASAILINQGIGYRAFAFLHELGHFLDLSGTGTEGVFASATSPMFADWLLGVVATPTFARLDRTIEHALANIPEEEEGRRTRLAVLRDPEELWARSYAQYIAARSGRSELVDAVAALRNVSIGGFSVPLQWEDQEFLGLAGEIDRLMRRLGWRSERRILTPGWP
jgi:hypothetical protein